MYRLGLRLVARSSRETFVRLVVTALAVGIGVMVLLGLLAEFRAFQTMSNRPYWESTGGTPVSTASAARATGATELWNYSENMFEGRLIEQLDVAARGPGSPRIPGLAHNPGPGQFYVSPALSRLMETVPADELRDRFPGQQAGLLGDAALSGPDELAIVVGYSPSRLAAFPGTVEVSRIAKAPQPVGLTSLYRLGFGIAALIIFFPVLVLINTSTRLGAARREERLASLRLVGATPRQVNVLASVDAVVTASAGVVIGVLGFIAIRPLQAATSLAGYRFFGYSVTPTPWGYLAVVALVPLLAAVSSLVSLRRVWITPLGVSRRTTPRPPGWWRVLPLLVGIPLFIAPLVSHPRNPNGDAALLGLALIMAGLALGGPWLTMAGARIMARLARGPAALLAGRRLSDSPRSAFRASAGLVLAVFAGTIVACVVPAFAAAQTTGAAAQLDTVLRVPFGGGPGAPGLDPTTGGRLVAHLGSQPGVSVVPVYDNPAADGAGDSVVSCSAIRALPALGSCAPGVMAASADLSELLSTDNPLSFAANLPAFRRTSPPVTESLAGLDVSALLVRTATPDALERVRTYLTEFEATSTEAAPSRVKGEDVTLGVLQTGNNEPETFGEVTQIRTDNLTSVERVALAVLALILVMAGCSLVVSVAAGVLDRKRPFTLLRLAGAPRLTLTRVALLESIVPLTVATVVAGAGAIAIVRAPLRALFSANLGPNQDFVAAGHPGPAYYVTVLAGLALSTVVVLAAMPLLDRITQPDNARFE